MSDVNDMSERLLSVDAIDVRYGAVSALRELSLHIDRGEMVALLGANGAGKSSTLRAISGVVAPAAGAIVFEGAPVHGFPPYKLIARGLAHLPEGRALFGSLTVEENLEYGHWTKRKDRSGFRAKRDEVMDHFPRLRERRGQQARTLSGGEQQMLGVARALMSSPKLLLVDELSLGLAPMIVQQLFAILRQVNQAGTSVLLVEQFVHMALANTHRAYVLAKGRVVLEGPSSELAGDPDLVASYLGEAASTTGTGAGRAGSTPRSAARAERRRRRTPTQESAGF